MVRRIFSITLLFMGFATLLSAAETKISGYMFGDYYWIAANHNADLEGKNGFWFRRIYLTFDQSLSEEWKVRLRFELNSPGDFTTSDNMKPYVKDAYLQYGKGRHKVILGLSPTPTWEVIEQSWGYRSIEKTPLDLQKFGDSRDLGLAILGSLDSAKKFRYHVMFANGNGTKSETNDGKKILGSLGFYPNEHFLIELYADFDDRPGHTDRSVLQGFTAVYGERGCLGLHYAHQNRQVEGGDSVGLDIASLFAVLKLSNKTELFARYDRMFDPNPDGAKISYIPFDPTAKSNLVIMGLNLKPHKNINFMPNVEIVFYDSADGTKPDTDIIPRLTFYYKF